jgi:hypothetical protein
MHQIGWIKHLRGEKWDFFADEETMAPVTRDRDEERRTLLGSGWKVLAAAVFSLAAISALQAQSGESQTQSQPPASERATTRNGQARQARQQQRADSVS